MILKYIIRKIMITRFLFIKFHIPILLKWWGNEQALEPSQVHLKFELHDKLNEYYVKVIEDSTNEVIREIPPKRWLDFYAAMTEFLGLFVDEKSRIGVV